MRLQTRAAFIGGVASLALGAFAGRARASQGWIAQRTNDGAVL
jgi:hypothetical protein